MKITVLIENTAPDGLVCEHGLSLLIEHNSKKILLDSGSSGIFTQNADLLGIDLSEVDFAVLSHGHYDHAGGFSAFLERNKKAPIYARREAVGDYYSANGGLHSIGIPEKVLRHSDRFVLVGENTKIADDIFLVGHDTAEFAPVGDNVNMYMKSDGVMIHDDFAHEQSLVFDTEQGLVVMNSCSHMGLERIAREARTACNKSIYAYIGGLHMRGKRNGQEICAYSEDDVLALCDAVKKEGIRCLYTGHCTGSCGFERLEAVLGDVVQPLTSGLVIDI